MRKLPIYRISSKNKLNGTDLSKSETKRIEHQREREREYETRFEDRERELS